MKRLICGMLSLALCLTLSASLAEGSSSGDESDMEPVVVISISDGEDNTASGDNSDGGEAKPTDEPQDGGEQQPDAGAQVEEKTAQPEIDLSIYEGVDVPEPEVRWSYPVSLTTLKSQYLILVNADHPLDKSYKPSDLVKVRGIKTATSAAVQLDKTVVEALKLMFDEAKNVTSYTYTALGKGGVEEQKEATFANGMSLRLKSGYRSYGQQATIYANHIDGNNNVDDGFVAKPGESEHQTGLSADIANPDYAQRPKLTQDFKWTPEAQWMKENCRFYGFILRYTEEDEALTGISFEPWHFRYVGNEAAGYIMSNNMTLESFTEEWQAAYDKFIADGGSVEGQLAYEYSRLNAPPESRVLDEYGEDGDAEVTLDF